MISYYKKVSLQLQNLTWNCTTMTFAVKLYTSSGVKLLRWLSDDIQTWLLLWNFAPVLVWNFCGDCLTTYKHGFCCDTLHQFWCETFAVIVWRHTNMTFAVKLCTSSGVNLLRWLSDDIQTWLLLRYFAPVLVWNFCGDCLTTYKHDFCCETLHQFWCEPFAVIVWRHTNMAFAAILCTSSGVKLLRWLSDDIQTWLLLRYFAPVLVWNFCGDCLTTYKHDFCCETLHQFWCETFAVIVWRHTNMAFAAILCTSSGVKLLRWLSDDIQTWLLLWNFAPVLVWNFCGDCLTTYKHGFCCDTLHQFWCETFAVIVWRHTNMTFAVKLCTSSGVKLLRWLSDDIQTWLLLRYFAPVLVWNFCGDCLTTYDHGFCCETLHQFWCETFAVIVWRHTNMAFAVKLCTSSGVKLLRWLSDDIQTWLLLRYFAPVLVWNFCGDCLTTYDDGFCCETLHQFWCETFAVIVWRHTNMAFAVKLCTSSGVKLLRWLSDDIQTWLLLWNFAPVLVWNFCGDCLTTYKHGFCCDTLHQFWCETFAVIVWRHTTMAFAVKLCTSSGVKLL